MKTIVSLAKEISAALETRTRNDGSEFVCFKDNSPEWMKDVSRTVQGDMLPNDERYRLFQKVIDEIADLDDDTDNDDVIDYLYDGRVEPDVMTRDLLNWISDNLTRQHYVDEYVESCGYSDLSNALRGGQTTELEEIAQLTVQALEEFID